MNIRDLSQPELSELLGSLSRNQICDKFEISDRTLSRVIKECSLSKANYGPKGLGKEIVHEIRLCYASGDFTQQELATKFGVSQSLIAKIVNQYIHKQHTDFVLGGSAEVKIGLNYGN